MPFPSTSILDDFNRSDSTTLGSNWSRLNGYSGSWTISGSAALIPASVGDGGNAWNVSEYGPDTEIYATIAALPGQGTTSVGLEARVFKNANLINHSAYHLDWNKQGDLGVYKVTANAFSQLGTSFTSTPMVVGYKIGMTVTGGSSTNIEVWLDSGSGWTSLGVRTDESSPFTNSGSIAMHDYDEGGSETLKVDNFGGGTVVTSSSQIVSGSVNLSGLGGLDVTGTIPSGASAIVSGVVTLDGYGSVSPIGTFVAFLDQEGYRWRNDDGSETAATWRQVQDTPDATPIDNNIRLRMLINTTRDVDPKAFELQYKPISSSVWQTISAGSGATSPSGFLSVSSNGRYLMKDGSPFLIIMRSPQGMMTSASPPLTDCGSYIATSASQGFNSIQVHVLAGNEYGGNDTNFATVDGIHPFTVDGDISTPNEAYFSRLDQILNIAASSGIYVHLNAAQLQTVETLWTSNGNTKCYNFGQYLGNRYKNFYNIVWMLGNDFQDWRTNSAATSALINMTNGIQSVDTNHPLYTYWMDYYVSSSRDYSGFDTYTTLDLAYSYYTVYTKIYQDYALSPAKPIFFGEGYYDGVTTLTVTGNSAIIRKQNYWSMLSGACGITYNSAVWWFSTGWQANMYITSASQIRHFKNLFEAYNWWQLVPDTGHTILTTGYGTQSSGSVTPDTNDYAPCAYIPGVSLAMIYMPSNRTMTVDMSQFSSTVTARWFDPTDGSYTADAASPVSNTGTHNFSRAGANAQGQNDWVLVLNV